MKKPFEKALSHWRSQLPSAHHRSLISYQFIDVRHIQDRTGKILLNMASNDFMGLSHHPAITQRAAEWAQQYGAGAGASRLVSGTLHLHQAVEQKLANHKEMPTALIMGSGYQANSAILSVLLDGKGLGTKLHVYSDKLIHASMHAGVQLAQAQQRRFGQNAWLCHRRFRHNDLNHLEKLIAQDHDNSLGAFTALILIESLYSMDGNGPDLGKIAKIANRYQAVLYIDDAHSAGGYGPLGKGLPATMTQKADLIMGTCSKALGGYGSYILCTELYRDYLINRAPGFMYSSAVPPALLGSLDAALDLIPTLDRERAHLYQISEDLRCHCRSLNLDIADSISHIIPIILGSQERMLSWADHLYQLGYLVGAIRPPTVAQGSARLRLSLSAAMTHSDLAGLKEALSRLRETGL